MRADDGWRGARRGAGPGRARHAARRRREPIDTGLAATEALRQAIAARLAPRFGRVVNGWLNHTRGGRWTEPPIEAALPRSRRRASGGVVYYPYGFLADNAESELEGRIALAAHPAITSRHLPA